jgi:hypothetical protein
MFTNLKMFSLKRKLSEIEKECENAEKESKKLILEIEKINDDLVKLIKKEKAFLNIEIAYILKEQTCEEEEKGFSFLPPSFEDFNFIFTETNNTFNWGSTFEPVTNTFTETNNTFNWGSTFEPVINTFTETNNTFNWGSTFEPVINTFTETNNTFNWGSTFEPVTNTFTETNNTFNWGSTFEPVTNTFTETNNTFNWESTFEPVTNTFTETNNTFNWGSTFEPVTNTFNNLDKEKDFFGDPILNRDFLERKEKDFKWGIDKTIETSYFNEDILDDNFRNSLPKIKNRYIYVGDWGIYRGNIHHWVNRKDKLSGYRINRVNL